MPKKVQPSHPFGKRLTELRQARGLTQIALAEMIGSTQRAISSYETVIELPPTAAVIALAKALEVSTDVLLGVETRAQKKAEVPREDPETRRLWKRFQPLLSLPEKDRRAVFRLVSSLLVAKQGRGRGPHKAARLGGAPGRQDQAKRHEKHAGVGAPAAREPPDR